MTAQAESRNSWNISRQRRPRSNVTGRPIARDGRLIDLPEGRMANDGPNLKYEILRQFGVLGSVGLHLVLGRSPGWRSATFSIVHSTPIHG